MLGRPQKMEFIRRWSAKSRLSGGGRAGQLTVSDIRSAYYSTNNFYMLMEVLTQIIHRPNVLIKTVMMEMNGRMMRICEAHSKRDTFEDPMCNLK